MIRFPPPAGTGPRGHGLVTSMRQGSTEDPCRRTGTPAEGHTGMFSRRIAIPLIAATLAVPSAPAFAQATAEPAPESGTAKTPRARKPAKGSARTAGAPPARSPILGAGGEDRAASLERRRRAFFATKPDEGGPDQPSPPSAGVTLGGSGGIMPGMGFKF